MFPTFGSQPAQQPATPQTPGPASAAPDPAPPTVEEQATPAPADATEPRSGDIVRVRFDNGRGTTVEQVALVVGRVDVPDVEGGKQLDSSHAEYDVVPLDTLRVRADHLVDDED